MTPAERVVVEAARRFCLGPRQYDDAEIHEAVAALEAERAAGGPVVTEVERAWDEVVEGDEIYSPKTRKWYPVLEAGALPEGRYKVVAKGLPKPIKPLAKDAVLVRRGETGQAVDMFASVLWSVPTSPSLPEAGPAPEVDVTRDPEASAPEPETEDEDETEDPDA